MRVKALKIMEVLASKEIRSAIYGSVARGDVTIKSDIDIVIPYIISSYTVEISLILSEFIIYSRKITQATPNHVPKAHIYLDLDNKTSVTFPLAPFRSRELEFYKFGGMLTLKELKENRRVPGCNKNQILIEPTERGHLKSSIKGHEIDVAKIVGVNIRLLNERVRVLTRRKQIGRTGVILSINLEKGEVFEEILKRLIDSNPIIRRRYTEK